MACPSFKFSTFSYDRRPFARSERPFLAGDQSAIALATADHCQEQGVQICNCVTDVHQISSKFDGLAAGFPSGWGTPNIIQVGRSA